MAGTLTPTPIGAWVRRASNASVTPVTPSYRRWQANNQRTMASNNQRTVQSNNEQDMGAADYR